MMDQCIEGSGKMINHMARGHSLYLTSTTPTMVCVCGGMLACLSMHKQTYGVTILGMCNLMKHIPTI